MAYELFLGTTLFAVEGEKYIHLLYRQTLHMTPEVPAEFSEEVAYFVEELLEKDASWRLCGGEDGTKDKKRDAFIDDLN